MLRIAQQLWRNCKGPLLSWTAKRRREAREEGAWPRLRDKAAENCIKNKMAYSCKLVSLRDSLSGSVHSTLYSTLYI